MKKQLTLIVLAAAAFFSGCAKKEDTDTTINEKFCLTEALKKKIEIEEVQLQNVIQEKSLTGTITYNDDDKVPFSSLVSGLITKTYFSVGDYVQKGQILAELKSTELNSLQAEKKVLEAQLKVAERQLKSKEYLFDSGVASQVELLNAQTELQVLKSQLENTTSNLSLYSASKENSVFQIKSPVSGHVVEKNANSGSQIAANDTPLFTVSNLSKVWAMVNVYSMNLEDVQQGMEVKITTPVYPGKVFSGKIERISQVFDSEEHVLKARIVLDNKDLLLKPGLTVDVGINSQSADQKMPAISANALIFDNNQNYVIIYKDDCHLERRKINPTLKNNKFLFFDKELELGEKVITKNHLLISEQLKENQLKTNK